MSDKNDLYWRDYEYQQNAFRDRDWQNFVPVHRDEPLPVRKGRFDIDLDSAVSDLEKSLEQLKKHFGAEVIYRLGDKK